MKHNRLITFIFFIIYSLSINAQAPRLYTSANGLANSQINNICQDNKGFIWISTENGLSRFDGTDFTTFRHDRNKQTSIASNLVQTVFEDSSGNYWIGTSAGLEKFETEYNTFTHIDLQDPEIKESDQHISSITEVTIQGNRRIIAASSGHGIYILDPDTFSTDKILQAEINSSLPSKFINCIFKDSRNWLWIAGNIGGICVIDLEKGEAADTKVWIKDSAIRNKFLSVTSFVEDRRSGNVILGTSNDGLLIYDSNDGSIRKAEDGSARSCRVESIMQLSEEEGRVLIGTENEGIKIFTLADERLEDLDIPGSSYDISDWKIHSLMEDNQGNIWIGAYQTGLMVIPKSMYGFEQVALRSQKQGVADIACVTSIESDLTGKKLWVGTDGSGLYLLDRNRNYRRYTDKNSGLSNNSIMSVVTDKRGRTWVATYLGGLFCGTAESGFRQFRGQKELKSDKIYCLEYSKEDDIIYIGTHGNGMSVISPSQEKVIRTFADDDNKWISNLYIDRSGLVWIGTYNGPMCYDPETGKMLVLNVDENLSTMVRSFCETEDGTLWVGTGAGLVKFDRSTGETICFTEDVGLSSNVINDIQEGNDGNLWISTQYGLNRFNPKTAEVKTYYQTDGLQENEFHFRSSFKAGDGKLYFGGIKGVTAFYPDLVDHSKHEVPPVYFSELRVMNEVVSYDPDLEEGNVLDKTITEASCITLPFSSNIFSIRFSVLEYTNPQKIMYAYMIDGFDDNWNIVNGNVRTATYTNLPSGRYKMKVKAFYDGTPEVFSYKEIGIRILPPWYGSLLAWCIYILLLIAAGAGIMRARIRIRQQKAEKEESEIKELKLKMFTNISHEIRTPLTLVMNPLKKMREAEQDPKQKDLYNLMYRNCLRILRLVNQLLDMRKIDNGQMKLHFLSTDVVYFIKDIMNSFENLATSKNIEFKLVSAEAASNLWIDQGNFDKIIFNILSNAFKHTPDNGRITIMTSRPIKNEKVLQDNIKEYIEFTIENSGKSVEESHLDRLFDRFFQVDIRDAKEGSGVGLNLAKMLVELHHGDIRAYNTESGMAFSIRIPVGCEHLSDEEMTRPTNHIELYTKMSEHNSIEDVTYTRKEDEESCKQTKTKKNIVLIDDDSEMRAYLKLELQAVYNVETFASAKDAWSTISTGIPDAVVTDLMMEDTDGAELCSKIKKNPGTNHIPVLILTSSSDERNIQRCMDSGADRFFTKPISLEILKSAIANAIYTRDAIKNKFSKEIDYRYNELEMADSGNQLIDKVIRIIRDNIDNTGFGVEDLSKEIGMSRVHLNRKLKEHLNISPSNLIRSIRLKQAAFLLINNKVNISEVAYKVGFSTHSYFSNSFHDFFGMTPKEFVAKYMDCKDEETLKKIFN